jgi:V/A-type H+-transporting ATPase subunit A
MELVLNYYDVSLDALSKGVSIESLVKLAVRESIGRFKYAAKDKIAKEFEDILQKLQIEVDNLVKKEEA